MLLRGGGQKGKMNKKKNNPPSVLLYSNSPISNSGYGKQARYILSGWTSRGMRVGCAPNYGMGAGTFSLDGYTIHPQGGGLSIPETIEAYKKYNYDYLVSLYDCWVLDQLADLARKQRILWIAHCPFDFTVLSHKLGNILSAATYILPFSRYGLEMVKRAGFENADRFIYHGCDTDIYKPLNLPKEKMRKWLGFKDKSFIITIPKMNKGDRVKIPEMLEAIKIFLTNNPDLNSEVGVYIHSMSASPQGTDLNQVIKSLELEQQVRFVDPYAYFQGYSEEEMARAYNASDLTLMATASEGFGIPIIESMACGVPVIASDWMTPKELLDPVTPELLVKPKAEYWTQVPSKNFVPDVEDIALKIETVLNTDPKQYKKKLAQYAHNKFDWDKIIGEWVEFFEFLPQYIDKKCLRVPKTTSQYLKRLSRKIEVYEEK